MFPRKTDSRKRTTERRSRANRRTTRRLGCEWLECRRLLAQAACDVVSDDPELCLDRRSALVEEIDEGQGEGEGGGAIPGGSPTAPAEGGGDQGEGEGSTPPSVPPSQTPPTTPPTSTPPVVDVTPPNSGTGGTPVGGNPPALPTPNGSPLGDSPALSDGGRAPGQNSSPYAPSKLAGNNLLSTNLLSSGTLELSANSPLNHALSGNGRPLSRLATLQTDHARNVDEAFATLHRWTWTRDENEAGGCRDGLGWSELSALTTADGLADLAEANALQAPRAAETSAASDEEPLTDEASRDSSSRWMAMQLLSRPSPTAPANQQTAESSSDAEAAVLANVVELEHAPPEWSSVRRTDTVLPPGEAAGDGAWNSDLRDGTASYLRPGRDSATLRSFELAIPMTPESHSSAASPTRDL